MTYMLCCYHPFSKSINKLDRTKTFIPACQFHTKTAVIVATHRITSDNLNCGVMLSVLLYFQRNYAEFSINVDLVGIMVKDGTAESINTINKWQHS